MKKHLVFSLLLVLVMSVFCACGKNTTSKKPGAGGDSSKDGGSVVVGITNDMDSLDPHKAVAAGTMEVLYNVFDGLVKVAPDGSMEPAIAKSYKLSDDAKTLTFTLRDDVTFHNGEKLTAEDVIYSLKRVAGMTDEKDIKVVSAFSIISDITEASSDEGTQVVVSFSEANTEMIYYFNTPIVKKGYDKMDSEPNGTGPFKFNSYKQMEKIVLDRYDKYYGDKAHLDQVTFKIYGSTDDAFMELLAGNKIDIYPYLSSDEAEQLKAKYNVISGDQSLIEGLYLNNANEKLSLEVRQAINYAVDRDELNEMVTAGFSTVINTCMFPSFTKYYASEYKDAYKRDVEKAKALLKEAGYENGLDLEITIPSNYQMHITVGELLVSQLKQADINATIKQVDWSTWLSDVYSDRKYEATIIGFDASMAPGDVLERYQSTHKRNMMNYNNPGYDAAYTAAKAATNEADKIKYYKDCQATLIADAASAYLMAPALIVAVNPKLEGYTFYPIYFMDMSKVKFK